MQPWIRPFENPIRTLVIFFVAWKILLLIIASSSPGLGYDTSTSLLLTSHETSGDGRLHLALHHIVGKLTRWDAIYFVKVANRGYLFEQEWAWGWGFTRMLAFCTAGENYKICFHKVYSNKEGLAKTGLIGQEGLEALVGIAIAHAAHFLSVLVLFNLTLAVFPRSPPGFAFTTASLHIISPAGIFLSAPYAESSFALLSFAGILLFTKSFSSTGGTVTAGQDILLVLSGIFFGIATAFRSNGIINGLLLLEEAFRVLFRLQKGFNMSTIRRLGLTGLGGLSVAAGFLLPQYIAYSEYCGHASVQISRPWCERALPSIYTFVQAHYWYVFGHVLNLMGAFLTIISRNVGLFNYWTLSNFPLFLLATPMFALMSISGVWALRYRLDKEHDPVKHRDTINALPPTTTFPILRNLGISQLMLALATLTTAHVQIISRISSAYPVWLWYITASSREGNNLQAKYVVQFLVIYSVIQGGLFASFLPPA
jgi:phosphatidylinositol glycan class V